MSGVSTMQQEEIKQMCLDLANVESEQEVIDILTRKGFWQNNDLWQYYGGEENNFSTIGNQQSLPEAALVEKVINCEDSVLMKECFAKGIDPIKDNAPQSIQEASEKFFNIKRGKLTNLSPPERGVLAKNICMVTSGSKSSPCIAIIDSGEGQCPEEVPNTLLSLQKSNKLRIPFVQGKFNMGGTGVCRFCGEHNLQLIITRRNRSIPNQEDYRWSFTVIRREDPEGGRRSSTYTYLAPEGKLFAFEAEGLPLMPGDYPNPRVNDLHDGTYIKLYEYQLPGKYRSNIVFDLNYRLSLLMPSLALPIRLFERRMGYKGHTMETTQSGLNVRLDEDRRDNLEEGYPSSSAITAMGENMTCQVFAFKKDKAEKYRKQEGIIFTINGQTHGYIPADFFRRKNVGMAYLSDSLLVIIDCSSFKGRSREDLFMNSRDRLSDCPLKFEIERELTDLIRNHQGLKELRERRRREEIEDKLQDSKPLADVLNDIVKKSPSLATLFIKGFKISNPFKMKKKGKEKKFEGKLRPTYFNLTSPKEGEKKLAPINHKFRVTFETDARNDYFDRDDFPGDIKLLVDGHEVVDFILNLWNGIATLTIKLPKSVNEGTILKYRALVTDDVAISDFINEFEVQVLPPAKYKNGGGSSRRKPPSDEEGEEQDKKDSLALPQVIEVRQDEWENQKFDKYSALLVKDAGEDLGYDFFINMDNVHLQNEIKTQPKVEPKLLEARYKYAMVLIGLSIIKHNDEMMQNIIDGAQQERDVFKDIKVVSSAISPILLPMISNLGDIDVNGE